MAGHNDAILTAYTAFQQTCAEAETNLEIVRNALYELPKQVFEGGAILSRIDTEFPNSTDVRNAQKWINYIASLMLERFPLAMKMENYIDILAEKVPLSIQMYMRQQLDQNLAKSILVPTNLFVSMLGRLGLQSNAITIVGESFSIIDLGNANSGQGHYIVTIPISRYQDALGWIPIGHEIGHVLYKHLQTEIQSKLQPLVIDKVGFFSDYYWTLKWFEEIFSDAVMTEFFGIAAILDFESFLSLERQLEHRKELVEAADTVLTILEKINERVGGTHEENDEEAPTNQENTINNENVINSTPNNLQSELHGTHPYYVLRIKMMLDFLNVRIGSNSAVAKLCDELKDSYKDWIANVPYPWCDDDFQKRITALVNIYIEKTGIVNNHSKIENAVVSVLNQEDLDSHDIIEIVYALTLCYLQQHSSVVGNIKDIPEKTYDWLLSRYGNP